LILDHPREKASFGRDLCVYFVEEGQKEGMAPPCIKVLAQAKVDRKTFEVVIGA
jgi:hypothetical protein